MSAFESGRAEEVRGRLYEGRLYEGRLLAAIWTTLTVSHVGCRLTGVREWGAGVSTAAPLTIALLSVVMPFLRTHTPPRV